LFTFVIFAATFLVRGTIELMKEWILSITAHLETWEHFSSQKSYLNQWYNVKTKATASEE
jgi:hypothetical protein